MPSADDVVPVGGLVELRMYAHATQAFLIPRNLQLGSYGHHLHTGKALAARNGTGNWCSRELVLAIQYREFYTF